MQETLPFTDELFVDNGFKEGTVIALSCIPTGDPTQHQWTLPIQWSHRMALDKLNLSQNKTKGHKSEKRIGYGGGLVGWEGHKEMWEIISVHCIHV